MLHCPSVLPGDGVGGCFGDRDTLPQTTCDRAKDVLWLFVKAQLYRRYFATVKTLLVHREGNSDASGSAGRSGGR